MSQQIAANISRISRLVKKAGGADVAIVAVSKYHMIDDVVVAYEHGIRHFGENRVSDGVQKFEELKRTHADIILHLIGGLQTNKADMAVQHFDVIETLDRADIIHAVTKACQKYKKNPKLFLQVNTGDEAQKSGCDVSEIGELLGVARDVGLEISGLMCIPPVSEPPALHFALLKKYADMYGLKDLSMGMSADFERAIKLGANYIRIGTAIFGTRSKP